MVYSNLERTHTVIRDQSVRKALYQKVCTVLSVLLRTPADALSLRLRSSLRSQTGGSHPAKYPDKVRLPARLHPTRLPANIASSSRSERDEEEVRERVNGPGLSAAS